MSSTAGADLCRITVVGPQRRLDISIPSDAPFAQLLPTILRHAGQDLANTGLAQGGWVLQRLDDAPLAAGSTPAEVNLRDGEILYLRPGMSQLPELSFDDIADVVATGVNEKTDRWRPEYARRFALGTAVAALAGGLVMLLMSGPPWIAPAAAAGTLSAILLTGAIVLSRAAGDNGAGSAIAYLALPYAFLAGLLAPARHTALAHLGAPHLMAGFAATVLVAVLAAFGIADGLPAFLGVGFAALLGTVGSAIAFSYDGVTAAGVAAITIATALALTPLLATVAFRSARVTLPPVPTSAAELRRDTLTVDGKAVLERTRTADRYVTGLAGGVALVGLTGEIPLALSGGWVGRTMCGAAAVALLLRSRVFRGRTQRLWFLVSGMAGIILLTVAASSTASGQGPRFVLLALLATGTAIVVGVGLWLPDHRPSPFWARATDVLELTVVVALIPLALGVVGLYGYIRGLSG